MAKTYAFSSFIKEWLNDTTVNQDVKKQIEIAKQIKKEINKTLQVANRRAENIENSKLASPAYKALVNELSDIKRNRFTKFSISGLNLLDPTERVKAIDTYSRALAFINNKTSSVIGARHFLNDIANKNDIPFEIANELVDLITDPQLTNGVIVVNNWDSERVAQMVSEFTTQYDNTVESQKDFLTRVENSIANAFTSNNTNNIDIWDL